jgi:holo-[acyl-carrier protein] synthase
MRIVGIGVDAVEVERVRTVLQRRSSFRERVFTPEEIAYCDSKAIPAQYFAARWAAREAARKALGGVRGMRWHDVSVERSRTGAPRLALAGAARSRAEGLGVDDVLVSFSHERSMALAFCVAVGGSGGVARPEPGEPFGGQASEPPSRAGGN